MGGTRGRKGKGRREGNRTIELLCGRGEGFKA